jgi:L-ribulose-5-phosphate 3-epimerase
MNDGKDTRDHGHVATSGDIIMMADRRGAFGVNSYSYMFSHSAAATVDHLSGLGIRHFELMAHPGHLWPAELDTIARRQLRARFGSGGCRLMTLNMPSLDINFAAASLEMRTYTVNLLSDLVRLASDLGAENVLIAPGKANPLFLPPRDHLVERFYAALDVLHPLAQAGGTRLLVENIPICFVPDAPGLMQLLDDYGADDIGIVYDVPNGYFINEDPAEGLRIVKDRLKVVHLSDTGRSAWRHDPIGRGDIDFSVLPAVLAEIGYAENVVLEIISGDADSGIFGSIDTLANMGWGKG